MKFYLKHQNPHINFSNENYYPVYIKKEITYANDIKDTILTLTKDATSIIYGYCDQKNFKLDDLFTSIVEIEPEKENSSNIQKSIQTTIRKVKQSSLSNFVKKIE